MKSHKEVAEMPDEKHSFPRVSLILPFELKMTKEPCLFDLLTVAADKAEKELNTQYPKERVIPVIIKLRKLISGIQCRQDKKSMCIFVSPLTEKVYYFTPTPDLPNRFQFD